MSLCLGSMFGVMQRGTDVLSYPRQTSNLSPAGYLASTGNQCTHYVCTYIRVKTWNLCNS